MRMSRVALGSVYFRLVNWLIKVLSIFFFFLSQTSPLKLVGRIEPETLRGAHSKVSSQQHQANPSGFSIINHWLHF